MLRKIVLSALMIGSVSAFAQQEGVTGAEGTVADATQRKWAVSIDPYASYQFEADIHKSDASVAVARAGATMNIRMDLNQDWSLNLGLGTEYSNYDFSNTTGMLPVERLRLDLYSVTIAPGVTYNFSKQWSVTAGVIADFSGEESADFSQTGTYGAYAAATYRVSDRLSLTFGLAGKTRLEDDFQVGPILGARWRITDTLTFATGGAARGFNVRLTQELNKQWAVSLMAAYEGREYRLNDSGAMSDAVLRDASVPVGVELAWKPIENLIVRGTAGVEAYQRIEFDNRDGRDIADRAADPAPFVMLSASYKF